MTIESSFLAFDLGGTLIECGNSQDVASIKKDAVFVLHELKARGYKLGVASNVSRKSFIELCHLGFPDDIFSFTQFSWEIGIKKPDLRFFNLFSKRAGCKASNICYIGDSLPNDILPALRVGWNAILLSSNLSNPTVPNFFTICRLKQLLEIF